MSRKPNPRSPERRPWHPAPYTVDDIYALQNLAKGRANEAQQARALDHILRRVCAIHDPTFIPDSDRETVFAEAKRHCGLQIQKLIDFPPAVVDALRKAEHAGRLNKETTDGE